MQFLANISLHLGNDTRYSGSYYGMLIVCNSSNRRLVKHVMACSLTNIVLYRCYLLQCKIQCVHKESKSNGFFI